MRLDKLLSHAGYGTRKEVKKRLKLGQVTVNGRVTKDGQTQVNPERDDIQCAGERVLYQEFVYLMMNKPKGVLSATEDRFAKTVVDLLEENYQRFEVFPVGRLDKDTVGLLLLTNDGKLAHSLLSPKKHVPKTYRALIDGQVTVEDQIAFQQGVMLEDGYMTLPARLEILDATSTFSTIEITIVEGKFHQIKRMFQSRGKRVRELQRLSMGSLLLDQCLKEGEYRELTPLEVEGLRGSTCLVVYMDD